MVAPPFAEDYQISYLLGTVEITIPGKRNGKQLLILGLFVIYSLIFSTLFAAILITMASKALHEGKIEGWYLLLLPLAIGLIGTIWRGFTAGYLFLWQFGGVEKIEVLPSALRIQKAIFGVCRTRDYPREQINTVSLATPQKTLLAFTNLPSTQFTVERTGPLYIQYGKTKRDFFGLGLDLQQAEKIVVILKQRLLL